MNEFQIPAWAAPYRDGQRTSAAQGAAAYMEYYSVDGSADDDHDIEERMVPHAPVLRPYASRTGTKATLAKMREMGWSMLVSASGAHRTEGFQTWASIMERGPATCRASRLMKTPSVGRSKKLVRARAGSSCRTLLEKAKKASICL